MKEHQQRTECGPRELAGTWRQRAHDLERYAPHVANAFRDCADELELALDAFDTETLSLEEAAETVGYHPDSVARLIRRGDLRNVGARHRPRVTRGELLAAVARRSKRSPARRRLAVTGGAGASSPDSIARDAIAARLGRSESA